MCVCLRYSPGKARQKRSIDQFVPVGVHVRAWFVRDPAWDMESSPPDLRARLGMIHLWRWPERATRVPPSFLARWRRAANCPPARSASVRHVLGQPRWSRQRQASCCPVFTVCYNSVSQCRCHVHHFKEGGVQGGQGGREVGWRDAERTKDGTDSGRRGRAAQGEGVGENRSVATLIYKMNSNWGPAQMSQLRAVSRPDHPPKCAQMCVRSPTDPDNPRAEQTP